MYTAADIQKMIIAPIVNGQAMSVYFIGIGGIGMSAIARYFLAKGFKVSGYDKTETALTKALVAEGMDIGYTDDVAGIPKENVLVVYTPAIPKSHAGLMYYQSNGFTVVKRSDILGAISNSSFNICIGGTHGKTTISTMVAHILRHSGYGANAFLGGIAVNYATNFWSHQNNVMVIEADEYDRSFLKLSPNIAVITSMDADHLDIYGDAESLENAFVEFGAKVKKGGVLFGKFGLTKLKDSGVEKRYTYSLQNNAADIYATSIRMHEGGYLFDVQVQGVTMQNFSLRTGGMHNVENAIAAIAVAATLDIEEEKIRLALADFKGVKRRFEYIIPPVKKQDGHHMHPVLIDDYAHHPEELKALLKSVRSLFPQRKVTVIFQPHLFSRTRDHAAGFASVLAIADRVILLPIYPARELPMEGVSSGMILDKIERDDKLILDKEAVLTWMQEQAKMLDKEFGEVIVIAGAGDIDTLVPAIKKILE